MPPIPRRDYSIPQPSGFQLGTDGKQVPFPALKRRDDNLLHNLVRRFFPSPQPNVQTAAQRPQHQPATKPNWPKDHTATILPQSPPTKVS